MKYLLTFHCEQPVRIPVQYKHVLQAALLAWLGDVSYTSYLHDEGMAHGKRVYKMYTFSDLMGQRKYDRRAQKLIYSGDVQLVVSSCMRDFSLCVEYAAEDERPLRLGDNWLSLVGCTEIEEYYEDCVVETLSPVSIHSTFELPSGKKKTYYYEPDEEDFSEIIRQNLVRKYETFYGEEPEDCLLELVPYDRSKLRKVILNYRGTVIVAWAGRFFLRGSAELIRMALLAGLGARNGIGLGCIRQLNE